MVYLTRLSVCRLYNDDGKWMTCERSQYGNWWENQSAQRKTCLSV